MHWPSLVAIRPLPRQTRLTPVVDPAAEPPLESIILHAVNTEIEPEQIWEALPLKEFSFALL